MEREKPPLDKLYGALADTILVCQLTNMLPVGDVSTETSVGSDLLPFPSPYTCYFAPKIQETCNDLNCILL